MRVRPMDLDLTISESERGLGLATMELDYISASLCVAFVKYKT